MKHSVLYVDDVRTPPKNYPGDNCSLTIVRTYEEAMALCEKGARFDIWSLDHDMGNNHMNGYQFLLWALHTLKDKSVIPKHNILVHSMNPVGTRNMHGVIKDIIKL